MSSSNDHRGDCPVSPTSSSTAMQSSSSSPTRRRNSSSTTGSYQSPGTRRLSAGGSPRRRGQHQLRRYNTPPVGSLAAGLRGNTTVEVVRPQEVGGEGEDGNNNKANQLSAAHEHLQQPPLGVTGVLCESHHVPVHGRGILHYTVYRPRLLHASGGGAAGSTGAPPVAAPAAALQVGAPLICIAGGPGLPSTYLQSLTYTITDRAVVLYDAIGCGQSPATVFDDDDDGNNKEEQHQAPQEEAEDIPADGTVEAAVYDLRALLDHLPGCTAFHLLGHSWGGCVAYEYARTTATTTPTKNHHNSGNIKQRKKKHCRSVILCSAPTSMRATLDECQRLLKVVQQELGVIGSEDDEDAMKRAHSLFVHRHECRLQPMPLPLEQAFSMAGFGSCGGVLGGGRGLANPAVRDWRIGSQKDAPESGESEDGGASGKGTTAEKLESPPVLTLTGQFDFVKDPGEWEEIFANFAAEELSDCSHYGMLERPSVFGTTCTKFLQQHDASKSTNDESVLSNDNSVDAGDTASNSNTPVIIQEEEEQEEEE